MTGEQATEAAGLVQADYNIPIHTMGFPDSYNEANVAAFTAPNKILVRNGETIALFAPSTDIKGTDTAPLNFELQQNYPNPFNPVTNIVFTIPSSSFVNLKVYNNLGEEISNILAARLDAGEYTHVWDAGALPSGVYFCRIEAGEFTAVKKLVLMK